MSPSPSPRSREAARRRGFTVIEILVASAMMAILVGLVLTVTNQILGSWSIATGKLTTNSTARVSMDILTQDLSSAVSTNDGRLWMVITQDEEAPDLGGSTSAAKSMWMRFYTSALDRERVRDGQVLQGDVNACGYWIQLANPLNPGKETGRVYALYRGVVDGKETFTSFIEAPPLTGGTSKSNGLDKVRTEFIPESPENLGDAFLAEGVVRLVFTPYWLADDPDAAERLENVDSRTSNPRGNFSYLGQTYDLPDFLDVSLTVLNQEGQQILEAVNDGMIEGDPQVIFQRTVSQHGQEFNRRIRLISRSL